MSAATPEMVREESILTPAQDEQMQRIDQNGDGVISKKEARAEARFAAEQIAKLSFWKMVALGIAALLFLSWIGNACLTAAVIALSKDLKVEGSALKNTNGDAISTLGQKKVYDVTVANVTRRALGEQGSGDTHAQHSSAVAQVRCANVLGAISSIEKGIDGSLVKIDLGSGRVWEPRASAATYVNLDNSFGIEQIHLDDQRDASYDVTCEISKAECENAPEFVCDAVTSSEVSFSDDDRRALSFEDAFDGEVKVQPRRLEDCTRKYGHHTGNHYDYNSASGYRKHNCCTYYIIRGPNTCPTCANHYPNYYPYSWWCDPDRIQ